MLKFALLALLEGASRHGYELKGRFEALLGGTWPLNIGQVYATLGRLERDALVESDHVEEDGVRDRRVYRLTDLGQKELDDWLAEETPLVAPVRDDLHLKVVVHALLGRPDAGDLIARHRRQALAALAALQRQRSGEHEPAARLVLDAAMLQLEAAVTWLDRCEDELGARPRGRS